MPLPDDGKFIRLTLKETCWRYQEVNNVQYFSPNSLVTAPLITSPTSSGTNPFPFTDRGEPTGFQYSSVLRPRPWTYAYGWMSFIPVELWYKEKQFGSLVDILSRTPSIEHFTNEQQNLHGYRLQDPNPWLTLEQELYNAAVSLKNSLHLPCVMPPLPRIFEFMGMYSTRHALKQALEKAREWFLVWLGLLSYLLGDAKYRFDPVQRSHYSPYPSWRNVLKEEGFSEAWMDSLDCPPIAQFSAAHRRVGCIVDLQATDQGPLLAEWLILHGVPVWYTWSEVEERQSGKNSRMQALRPPVNMREGAGVSYLISSVE